MRTFRFIPDDTHIGFIRYQYWAYAFSGALMLLTVILLLTSGLNFGIDFKGGILMEIGVPDAAPDLAAVRADLDGLALGEVALQTFGKPSDIMIRLERQPGGEEVQHQAIDKVKAALGARFGEDLTYRRIESVGAKVSGDLIWSGVAAMIGSCVAILLYVWFRFEWQFALGGVIALAHDAVSTIGLFAVTGMEFNLTIVAAVLTIIGYSINDTVVIYDRVRENLRRSKSMPLAEVIDRSINETLARTIMTSCTTLLAVLALVILGGPVIRGFSIAMLWGIVIGTYSTIYVASPMVLHFHSRPGQKEANDTALNTASSQT